jgi:hypothetical protein
LSVEEEELGERVVKGGGRGVVVEVRGSYLANAYAWRGTPHHTDISRPKNVPAVGS